jgi:DNA polymerase (family X)
MTASTSPASSSRPGWWPPASTRQSTSSATRTGTALEVNGSPHRLDLGDEQVRLAHEFGVMLSFGSDSHGPGHLANMRFAVATAGRGWTTADRVINTLPLPELRRFLAKGRPGR